MGNIISVSCGIDNMVARCWDCTAGRANYTIDLEENLATLKVELEELKELRNDLFRRVVVAERQNMQRMDRVEGWLYRAETEIVDIEKMIDDGTLEIQKLCLGVSCSRNPLSGYQFGKEVAKKLLQVGNLKSKGDFEVVADEASASVVAERPSEPTFGQEKMFAAVWSSFEDVSKSTIGIHGMGGIGKTTLLTRLNNDIRLSETHDYDVVIWITVSRGGEVEMFQEEIAKRIRLYDESSCWKSKRVDEKAVDIYKALAKMRFVLLLDDVWERVDLSKIGVPIPSPKNGSKLVFTCRSEEVCWYMEPQRIIKVECLSWDDAWRLFKMKIDFVINQEFLPEKVLITKYARKIAEECCGLPIALITVGRAMASKKTVQEWRHASEVLSKCASEFSGMGDVVFPLLKFSYDALPSDTVRSCFLDCALLPGRINKTKLIDYWIGAGFLERWNDVSSLQDQGHDVMGCLVNASLLQDQGESVAMHDVIRDMAIWIACDYGQNNNVLVRIGAHLTEPPNISKWVGVKRMSLSANKIESLEEALLSSNLQTLILDHNCLRVITNDFFHHLSALTVLDLSFNTSLVKLPPGISKLLLLQHLNLSMTGIRQLPSELRELVKMKCLNLDQTSSLVYIPNNVISSFSQLQVLRMAECGTGTEVADLRCLKSLSVLTMTIRSAMAFQRLLGSHKKFRSCTQELSIHNLSSSKSLDVTPLVHMEYLEVVHVRNCSNLEVMEYLEASTSNEQPYHPLDPEIITTVRLASLSKVFIDNCPELRDLTWVAFAPHLSVLSVSHCRKVEHIIVTEKIDLQGSLVFPRMELLYLFHLVQLKSICSGRSGVPLYPATSRTLIRGCPKLTRPPHEDSVRQLFRSDGAYGGGRYHDFSSSLS